MSNSNLLRHFQAFLEESGLSRISIKNYVSDVRQFLVSSQLESARLITHKHLQDYLTQIQNTKPTASYKRYSASMRQFVSFLALEYRINLPWPTPPKIDPSPLTTQDITNQFKAYLQNEKRSHSTIKNYVSDLNHYWAWSANPGLPRFARNDIDNYLNHLKLSHTKSSVTHRREAALNKFLKFITPLSSSRTRGSIDIDSHFRGNDKKPSLYQRYNNLPFVPYLHLALLVLFTTALGIFAYDQVIKQAKPELAYPTSLTRPTRQLSFQGRLTDSSDTPITTATNLSFKLYSALTGGSALYNSGTCSVSPDTDGIFNTVIGNGTCGAEIGSNIFSENASLYLEVLVGAQTLTPRQPIATVGYALNSETLQGYPASASAVENTVPIMNNDGDIILGASSPTIQSTSDTFAIKGQAMTLSTNTATNGNISLAPDGTGAINAIGGATTGNFLRVTDANLTSGSLISGYVGNDTATGNLLSLSSGASETTKFVVKSSGNVGVGTTVPQTKLHVEGACVTGDTLLRRRRRRRGKNGEWIEDWEDVRIDEIEAGDEILTLDEKTGKFVTQKIKGLMDMGIQETYLLVTESGKQIRTTAQHPYFVKDTKKSPLGDFQDPANSSSGLTPKESIAGNSQLSNGVWTAGESSPSGLGVNPDLEPFAAHTTDIVTKNAQWKKVSELKIGMQIAVSSSSSLRGGTPTRQSIQIDTGSPREYLPADATHQALQAGARDDTVAWETIIVLKKYSREQVYDIEVEGTHNFVANGIVAHNTTGKALAIFNETGDQNIFTASQSGIPVFNLARVAGTAANGLTFTPAIAGGTVLAAVTGSDTDIALSIDSKGADALNLNGTATGDVNIAGGFGGTGCTVTNSNGNLSCNGTITGTFSGTIPWSEIDAPTANLSLAHAGYTTAFTFDSVTAADAFALSSSSLTTGTILDLSSTSTAGGASGLSKVLDIGRSGTNTNASHTAYGLFSAVTNTGTTSTNVGGYFSASGATNNYGLIVGAGDATISATLSLAPYTQGAAGTCNAAAAGKMYYDGPSNVYYFCNGTTWTQIGSGSGGGGAWSDLTLPTGNLSLAMAAYTSTFTYNATTSTANLFNLTDTTSNTGTGYLLNLTTASSSTLKPFHVSAAGTEALMVNADGRVGIGTTGPSAKLAINGTTEQLRLGYDVSNYWSGTVGSTGGLTLAGTGTGGALTLTPTSGQNLNVSLGTTGDFAVNTNQLYVDTSAGFVGIGDNTPSNKLDVNGVVAGTYFVDYSNAAYGLDPSGTTNFGGYSLQITGGALLAADSGNVGIGTATPTAKLDVGGTASVSGILSLASSIGTQAMTSMNIGNSTTGTIVIDSGSNAITLSDNVTLTTGVINSSVATGATAVGFTLNTASMTTQGSKLLSLQNASTEKFYIDKDGNLYAAGTILSGNGQGMLMTNKSGGTVAVRGLVIIDTSNNSAFTTTTTAYAKTAFGVVTGVGLGVTNDADGDGACDANDICMIAIGGEVNVTTTNASTASKGDYLFTSATAGSAVASAKQFDGLIGVVSSTANAASGYLKMIFKVQPQVTAAASIDKGSKHNEYWLYANKYTGVGEGSDVNANLLTRGLMFDNLSDSTKTDSANTTVSSPTQFGSVILANAGIQSPTSPFRTGLIGGQTLATSTTDNAGNTYLGSNTVNKTFLYDRTRDSSPQVQVELGIDPNWYNGVTLAVATSSASFSSNSVILANAGIQTKSPSLSTTYNGSLVKATGTYTANAKTIYITIKSPTTFDWTNYNGQAATGVTITPGTAQTLGGTGVSATFTNARYNTGDVFKIASWFVEPASSTRGGTAKFPERSTIIATASSVDIIDADTQKLWMRFSQGTSYAIGVDANNDPNSVNMLNGKMYVATNGSSATGLYGLDFVHDAAFKQNATDWRLSDSNLAQRNGTNTYNVLNTSNILVNITANDVAAAVIPNQPTQNVTVSGWGYFSLSSASETVNLPYKFNGNPNIVITSAGHSGTTAPVSLANCTTASAKTVVTDNTTTTSFTARESAADATNYQCYSWTATGQVSPRQFVAAATDAGVTVINETDGTAYSYSDVTGDDYNSVQLTTTGKMYALNETQAQLEKWRDIASNTASETNGAPDKSWKTSGSLNTSLTAYWKLDETSGSRADSVGSNTLTDNNTVTSNPGKLGNAGQFAKANLEYLSRADNTDLSTGDIDFTAAAWVYADSDNAGHILGKGWDAVGQQEYVMHINGTSPNRYFGWEISSTGSNFNNLADTSVTNVANGTWHFVVIWHDSVNNQRGIQVDNTTATTQAYSSGGFNGTDGFAIGRGGSTSPGSYFDGRIDEVGFWKKVLTAQERTDLYNSGNASTHPFGSTPSLTASSPTIQTSPSTLSVTEKTSPLGPNSDTIYVGTDQGVSVIQDKESDSTAGDGTDETNGSVKYYTKDYISEEMVGDIRGMWPLSANGALSMSDASVKANTLTNNGTVTAATGVRGVAASTGSSKYLSCTDAACGGTSKLDPGTSSFTIGAWVKSSDATNAYHDFISKGGGGASGYRMSINAGNVYSDIYGSSASTLITSGTNYADNNWHYIVTTVDRTAAFHYLYIDGVLVKSQAISAGTVDTANAFSIGSFNGADWYFTGTIDEPFVTATALTSGQIKNMYQVGYRALQSHATTLGGGAADTNQQLGGTTNTIGAAQPDLNNQFMYVGTNSTTLGAVSKIDLNSDTNIKTYNSSANVPAGGALLIDEDTKSLAVGYNLEAVGSATTGVKTMGVDNNATATSGNFISKTVTTAESFTQAYLWAQYTLDSSDASNTVTVSASNDGGTNYYQCNLTNTDTSQTPTEYEYFCQFNAAGSSLKTKFAFARGSTKTNTYVTRYGIAWIGSDAIGGSPGGNGLYTNNNSAVADGSYIEVAHNQSTNDVLTNGWVSNESKWKQLDGTYKPAIAWEGKDTQRGLYHNELNLYKTSDETNVYTKNLLENGLLFDTFEDSTKTDSANTTTSIDLQKYDDGAANLMTLQNRQQAGRAGLYGGQTLATSTTDNAGNTYLGSNTVNKTFLYDRTRDSSPQVQVELGIDPNWYNGVTLAVATTSAQFSQNSVIVKNPNLSTTYNGSAIKVTGAYTSNAKTIYITIKSPTTFDWTDYNGNSASGVTITPGTAQTLGGTGVSAKFSASPPAGGYNTGDVFKIASWFVEPSSSTRGGTAKFPERSTIIATAGSVDIIDADTQKLWMRFTSGSYWNHITGEGTNTSISALNGSIYIGKLVAGNVSWSTVRNIDFKKDSAINYTAGDAINKVWTGGISLRNGNGTWSAASMPDAVAANVNDVSAAVIPNAPTQNMTVSGWGYITGTGATSVSESVNLPYTFNNTPIITVAGAGYRGSSVIPTKLSDCTGNNNIFATVYAPGTTSFTSLMTNRDGVALATTETYCYTWTATGQVSPRQYVAVGTNAGLSLINETDQLVASDTTAAVVSHVYLSPKGPLYATRDMANNSFVWVKYNAPSITGSSSDLLGATSGGDKYYAQGSIPVAFVPAVSAITSLAVTEGTSTIDGKSNTIFVGSANGLTIIQEKQSGAYGHPDVTDEKNGSVKYYTSADGGAGAGYISEEMVGDIRGMWPLSANGAISMSDASVKADTLTNNNTATAVTGVRGAGVSLNGTTQYLSCTDAACGGTSKLDGNGTSTTAWAAGAWIKTPTTARMILSKNPVNTGYALLIENNVVEFRIVSANIAIGKTTVTDNQWHFVVGTYDGSNMRLYIDGRLEATTAYTGGIPDVAGDFTIGVYKDGAGTPAYYFNGSIDEPFVTATALTAGQIKHMYEVGYRALQSHATTLGGGGADLNQQLGFISTGTNTVGAVGVDYNNQFMYVGTNSTTLGAVSKIDLNSDTNIKTYNSSANVPTGGALLIDEDTKSLAVGYNLEAVGSATTGVKTMGVDNNATATSGSFYTKTYTLPKAIASAVLWVSPILDSSDASNTLTVKASVDGGSTYATCTLVNTDTNPPTPEREYACTFAASGTSLKVRFDLARGSTKTNTYLNQFGITWLGQTGFRVEQASANAVRLYNYTGESQNLRLDVITGGLGRNAGTVSLAPAAADVDSQSNVNSIWINKTGTGGNLLKLQTSGADVLSLASAGTMTLAGNFLPGTDNTYALGSTSNRWKDLFLGPTSLHISSTTGTSGVGANYVDATLGYSSNALTLATAVTGTVSGGGSINLTSGLALGNTTTSAFNFTTSADFGATDEVLQIGDSAANFMTVLGNGNVGIGTTGPAASLHVTSGSYGLMALERTGTGAGKWDFMISSEGVPSIGSLYFTPSVATGDFVIRDSSSNVKLYVDTSAGNVGIGTTGPGYKLDIVGGATNVGDSRTSLAVRDDTSMAIGVGSGLGFYGYTTGTSVSTQLGAIWGYKENITSANTAGGVRIATNPNGGTPTTRLTIDSTGNVGIGTVSPTQKLNVDTGVSAVNQGIPGTSGTTQNGILRLRPGAATYGETLDFGMNVSSTYGWIQATNATSLATNYSLALNPNGGNVGIGTTGPGELLELSKASAALKITGDNGAGLTYIKFAADAGPLVKAQISAAKIGANGGYLAFSTNDSSAVLQERVRIIESGNVGIGTTDPGAYKLYVSGNAYTTGTWGGSDIRWKQNIKPIANALDKVLQLQGVNFDWNKTDYPNMGFSDGTQLGLIAQQVESIVPEIVSTDNNGYKAIEYGHLTALLIEGIKEQQGQIGSLSSQLAGLLQIDGSCVTGDTLLPIRRRRKKRKGDVDSDEDVDDFDEILCPIRDIQPGDEVLSLNESTGALEHARINALKDMGIHDVYELTTKSGRVIRTTANHPYLTLISNA